jgi:mannose-6-phosphate isomerase-like protein (cupin superfamily)
VEERGASAEEITDVIVSGTPMSAKFGRLGKTKTYDFKKNRLGNYYEHKRVEVFFVVEGDVIVTVTVYVFYGKWEIGDGNSI